MQAVRFVGVGKHAEIDDKLKAGQIQGRAVLIPGRRIAFKALGGRFKR